jgi:hypothetical protein
MARARSEFGVVGAIVRADDAERLVDGHLPSLGKDALDLLDDDAAVEGVLELVALGLTVSKRAMVATSARAWARVSCRSSKSRERLSEDQRISVPPGALPALTAIPSTASSSAVSAATSGHSSV